MSSAFKKAALVGAAGLCFTGYHFYGTQEDVEATVTAVTTTASGDQLITTDQGTFINRESLPHLKFQKSADDIGSKARPGVRMAFRVYGLNPSLGKFDLQTFGLHRGIIHAAVVSAPEMSTPEVLPPSAAPVVSPPQPTGPYQLRTTSYATLGQDKTLPRSCARSDQLEAMREATPLIYNTLALMERLPITGREAFTLVTDGSYVVQSCLIPYDPNSDVGGTGYLGRLNLRRDAFGMTGLHEFFHTIQLHHVSDGNLQYKLTPSDHAYWNLVLEAVAFSYSYTALREAGNQGLTVPGFEENPMPRRIDRVFDAAYDETYAQNADMTPEAREAAALQAGGQAVVRMLLASNGIITSYRDIVVGHATQVMVLLGRNTGQEPGYADVRRDAFARIGRVSADFNLTPPEYLGPDAQRMIDTQIDSLGLRITAPASADRAPRPGA